MYGAKRILIVGKENNGPRICERLLKTRFEAKRTTFDTLGAREVRWSEFILVVEGEHRRMIAERFPNEYLSRRVVSLNVPEGRAEDVHALESMIREQLANHGLLPRDSGAADRD